MTLRLRGCNRCGGDLSLERDLGAFVSFVCIQCGHEQGASGTPEISAYTRGDDPNHANTGRQIPSRRGAA